METVLLPTSLTISSPPDTPSDIIEKIIEEPSEHITKTLASSLRQQRLDIEKFTKTVNGTEITAADQVLKQQKSLTLQTRNRQLPSRLQQWSRRGKRNSRSSKPQQRRNPAHESLPSIPLHLQPQIDWLARRTPPVEAPEKQNPQARILSALGSKVKQRVRISSSRSCNISVPRT